MLCRGRRRGILTGKDTATIKDALNLKKLLTEAEAVLAVRNHELL